MYTKKAQTKKGEDLLLEGKETWGMWWGWWAVHWGWVKENAWLLPQTTCGNQTRKILLECYIS